MKAGISFGKEATVMWRHLYQAVAFWIMYKLEELMPGNGATVM
jgi:hypothetical protein